MSAVIQVRKTQDGRIQARRLDGKPMSAKDLEEARRLAGAETEPTAVDRIIDDQTVAVLIDSTLLGAPVWFALLDGWRPDETDRIPIFYASELKFLRTKSLETLRDIFNVKTAFGGGMVR